MQATNNNLSQIQLLFSKFDEILHTKCSPTIGKLYAEYESIIQDDEKYSAAVFAKLCKDIDEPKHSKIIAKILENKDCTDKFIELLNKSKSITESSIEIDKNNYKNFKILTEKSHIDIQIQGMQSMHVIIIESKITGAKNRHKQLYRYYQDRKNNGFDVDAVVYLVFDEEKRPDMHNWPKNEDSKQLKEKLVILPVEKTDKNPISLQGFLEGCKPLAINNEIDEILNSTIIQYEQLLGNKVKEQKMTPVCTYMKKQFLPAMKKLEEIAVFVDP